MEDATTLAVLAAAALSTSALTAVAGLGGGIILLAIMLLYLEPLVAIPLHAAIQLVSNSSRAWIQRRHVRAGFFALYALPLLPMAYLGLLVGRSLEPEPLKAAIGLFVLVSVWAPGWILLGASPDAIPARPRFLLLGALVGFLSTIVGATGPLQGPFFQGLGLPRQGVVGTFAACQAFSHVAKLVVFGLVGFAFLPYLPFLVLMCAMVVVGTWLGSRLLDRVSERAFVWLYRGSLTLVALRLLSADGARWLAALGLASSTASTR